MAQLAITSDDHLQLTLTRRERIAALHGDIRVPVSAVRDVRVAPDALAAVRGLRAPGLNLPGRVKIGTWRGRRRKRFAVARRGVPAVHVFLAGAAFDELIVSTPHADVAADTLRAQLALPPVGEHLVSLTGPAGRLAGTLTLPAGPGPHPAALLLPGSGPLDRDGNHRRMRLNLSAELARLLAGRGVASLRYDRRGVGGSEGSFLATGLHDNVADARAALDWMRGRPDVGEAFLVGHSEGALLAVEAADEPVAGVVLLASPAKTGEQTLAWQTHQVAAGLPRAAKLLLRALRVDIVAKQAKNVEKIRATRTDVARIGGRKLNVRWLRELLAFDPSPGLARLRAPVLAITGAKDIQVDPADLETLAAMGAETVRVPDLTHLLRRDAGRPSLSTYKRQLRRPADPEVLALVGDWIVAHRAAPQPELAHAERG